MKERLLQQIEREVSSWPGVTTETGGGGPGKNGFWVPPATIYRFGRRHLGHVHHDADGLADFSFPREVRDGLIRSGRAIAHPAFPDSRTDVSHEVKSEEDLPEVIALFHMSYERAKTREARHAARTNTTGTRKEAT